MPQQAQPEGGPQGTEDSIQKFLQVRLVPQCLGITDWRPCCTILNHRVVISLFLLFIICLLFSFSNILQFLVATCDNEQVEEYLLYCIIIAVCTQ